MRNENDCFYFMMRTKRILGDDVLFLRKVCVETERFDIRATDEWI